MSQRLNIKPFPSIASELKVDDVVWRYISFEKFDWLLRDGGLRFCHPSAFHDQHEGLSTKGGLNEFAVNAYDQYKKQFNRADAEGAAFLVRSIMAISAYNSCILVNCWNQSPYESTLMWSSYAGKEGLVIRSTVGKLQNALAEYSAGLFKIQYIDHSAPSKEVSLEHIYCYKRREFDGENEVRAFYLDNSTLSQKITQTIKTCRPQPNLKVEFMQHSPEQAKILRMNLNDLIDGIVLHPNSAADCHRIETAARNAGLFAPVVRSTLTR